MMQINTINEPGGKAVPEAHPRRRRGVRVGVVLTAIALAAVLIVGSASSAGAAHLFTWGPGVAGYARVNTWVGGKTATTSTEVFYFDSGRYDKANRCGTGVSIWYTGSNGARYNYYEVRDGCTPGPQFWYQAGITMRRGTTTCVTYRAEWQWYSGPCFRVG